MKEKLRDFFHTIGLDIRRWDDMSVFSRQLIHILKYLEIDLVLDVGAHEGQYASMLFRTGYDGHIISLEPASKAYKTLKENADNNPNWIVENLAAGNGGEKTIELNISGGNRSSSSILRMNKAHLDIAPHTAYTGKEKIDIFRLDELQEVKEIKDTFLKIDTQGYEMQVLEGAAGIIDSIKGVQVELSTCELYEGQALDWEIKNWLTERGFTLWALNPFLYDPKNGKLLQYDAIFIRENSNGITANATT